MASDFRLSGHVVVKGALGLFLLFTLSACTLQSNEPDTCDQPGILFLDDFSGEQSCGWATYNRGGGIAEIENETMQITATQPGQIWWTNPGRNFTDVIVSAEARQVSGPNDNAYGLICRYQNEENFYVFLVSGDGYYAIAKYQSGVDSVVYLTEDQQFQPSDVINQGAAINNLEARCIGNQLSLTVNGTPLLSVNDPTFVIGDIGLAASTLQPGTTVIQFDNVQVTAP
ncbi:MAG: hypothetical protein R6X18_06800 [Chloroflexota bacterium]|jgi:hypothetical protein